MSKLVALIAIGALLVAGCASFDGRGLLPGKATLDDVIATMGPPADRRVKDGETWLYYPRQPYGYAEYVARIGRDGKLIAIEQRLTEENVKRIQPGKTRREEALELLGPPYKVWEFPRMPREVFEYRMSGPASVPQGLYVQMTPDDGIVREVYVENDPDNRLSECCARF